MDCEKCGAKIKDENARLTLTECARCNTAHRLFEYYCDNCGRAVELEVVPVACCENDDVGDENDYMKDSDALRDDYLERQETKYDGEEKVK